MFLASFAVVPPLPSPEQERPLPAMPSVTLSLLDAKHVARALVPHTHASDHDKSVLRGVWIDPPEDGGGQYAYASDRYTAAQFDLTAMIAEQNAPEGLWIPREALAAMGTIGKQTLVYGHRLQDYEVTFSTDKIGNSASAFLTAAEVEWRGADKDIHELHWQRAFRADGAGANRPPVGRLIKGFRKGADSRTHLGGEYVERLSGYARWLGGVPIRITLSDGEVTGKASPVLMEVGHRLKAVVQPVIVVGSTRYNYGLDVAVDNQREYEQAQAKLAKTKEEQSNDGQ